MAERFGVVVHAYCLMPNHDHLLLQTHRANVSDAVGLFQDTYTIRFNHHHRRSGRLFQVRFKAYLVEAAAYAIKLIKYIHLNPVRSKDKRKPIPPTASGGFRVKSGAVTPCMRGSSKSRGQPRGCA